MQPNCPAEVGASVPPSLSANSAKKRICSAVTGTSPDAACATGRDEQIASRRASASASASMSAAQRVRAHRRSRGAHSAQPDRDRAARAAVTARSTVSASPFGMSRRDRPSDGARTSIAGRASTGAPPM